MPATATLSRDDLEALLRQRKLDHTVNTAAPAGPGDCRWLVPTGLADLDARLGGGFPRGHLSEIVGPRSSGRLALAVSALAGATGRGEAVALIDPLDMFDPVSAAGIDFTRMLWVRGEASGAARLGLSAEYGTVQKSVDRAVKALNLVLQAGGFGLVVLDVSDVPPAVLQRLPFTTWLRLARSIEGRETACVLLGSEPVARSAGGVSVLLARPAARGQEPESRLVARVVRSRAMATDADVRLSCSAAVC